MHHHEAMVLNDLESQQKVFNCLHVVPNRSFFKGTFVHAERQNNPGLYKGKADGHSEQNKTKQKNLQLKNNPNLNVL